MRLGRVLHMDMQDPPIAPITGSLGAAVEEPLYVVLSGGASGVDKVRRIAG